MKKLFVLLLALCLLLPAMAMAENTLVLYAADDAGTNLLSTGMHATLADGKSYVLEGSHAGDHGVYLTVSGSAELTLKNVNVHASKEYGLYLAGELGRECKLDLMLEGESQSFGPNGGLRIENTVTVTIDEATDDETMDILNLEAGTQELIGNALNFAGDLTVTGGTINAKMIGYNGYGVDAWGSLTVKGNGTINAESAGGYGVRCGSFTGSGRITVSENGTLTGKATSTNGDGIYCDKLTVSGGEVIGESVDNCGISAEEIVAGGSDPLCFMGGDDGDWMYGVPEDVIWESRVKILPGVNVIFKANGLTEKLAVPKNSADWQMPDLGVFGVAMEGYTINGWKDAQGHSYDVYDSGPALTQETTFTADVTKNPWITYLDMHGDAHTSSVDKDMSVMIDDYEGRGWDVPEGQVFSHWLAQETGDELQAGDIVLMTKDLVLEPVFAQAVTITWLNGDGFALYEQRVPKGSVQPVFPMRDMQYSEKSDWSMLNTQEGEFIGWTVADNGFMLPLDRGFIADRDMTMLANYELKPMAHVYFYDQITGHGYGRYVPVGSKIKAPAVDTMRYEEGDKTRHFLHWVDDETGKAYKPYAPITVTGDMRFTTYHEVYEEDGNVTIRVMLSPDAGVTLVSYPAGYYFYAGWAADGMRIKGVRYDGKLYDAHGELSLWGLDGKKITLELVHEKLPEPTRIPWGAAADLPQTGDPSMLGAWALLLGAASAMGAGMKLRRKK